MEAIEGLSLTTEPHLHKVPEFERLKIHNLFLQQLLLREQLRALICRFLQTPEAKVLQDKIDGLAKEINAVAAEIFASSRVDANEYQFNVETGKFIKKISLI
jgi:hypothetical protein